MSDTPRTAAQAAGESIEQKIARLERELADTIKDSKYWQAAYDQQVQDLELLSLEKGQLKENLAVANARAEAYQKDAGITPCCQEWDTCDNRCAPLVHHLRERAEAAEARCKEIERENRELKEGWRQAKLAIELETVEKCIYAVKGAVFIRSDVPSAESAIRAQFSNTPALNGPYATSADIAKEFGATDPEASQFQTRVEFLNGGLTVAP